MPAVGKRFRTWLAWAGLAGCLSLCMWHAEAAGVDPATFLDQTEALRRTDHPRFERQLAQLHGEASRLTSAERWHLRYLDAWEALYEGDDAKSGALFRDVIAHAGNRILVTKASALLLSQLGISRHYGEAFALANRLAARLPEVDDPQARFLVLLNLSQAMGFAGQTGSAVRYALMAGKAIPPGETRCLPMVMQVEALDDAKRLTLSSPELRQAIHACAQAGQPVFANTLWLTMGGLYLAAGKADQTLALLDRIAPSIRANHYFNHVVDAASERAQAYAALGNDTAARKAALAVLAMSGPGAVNEPLRDAYDVLYRVARKYGHAERALKYYEQYAAMDRQYLDDVNARALAYESVQQRVLAQKLETEQLSRQNAELRMRQALGAKSVETVRLYLAMLLMVLAFAVLWMFRLKRSQLRFQRLSRLDSLTAVFNRQHFMEKAARMLSQLERQRGEACMVFIDLDHFKRINDSHGHAAGDEVLRHVAATIRQHLRPGDLFGRLGGEEFGILLTACAGRQCAVLAERIRHVIEAEPGRVDGTDVPVSISLGLSSTDACGYDLRRLCMEADAALYRAKRRGRNCVVAGGDGPSTDQCTPISSTSNTSVAFGGTAPSAPRLP